MVRRLLLVSCLLGLVGCMKPIEGPPVDLVAIAAPDPLPTPPPAPKPAPGPQPGAGRWRAWIPRQVAPGGDVTEGTWLELSASPPVLENVEPSLPLPRAPKTPLVKKSVQASAPPVPVPPPPPPMPGLPGLGHPQLPVAPPPLFGGQP